MVRRKRLPPPVFLREWLRVLDVRPASIAKNTSVSEPYISQIVSGQKKNPSPAVIGEIADYLRIPREYLYRPPPDNTFLHQLDALDPAILARLRRRP